MHQRFEQRRAAVSGERRKRHARQIVQAISALTLIGALTWVAYSPLVTVRDVQVAGAVRLDPAELSDLVATTTQVGTPLHQAAAGDALSDLDSLVGVQSVTVTRPDPVTVRFAIIEHEPAYVVQSDAQDGLRLVTVDGYVIGDEQLPADRGLPTVTLQSRLPMVGEALDDGQQAAVTLHQQLPDRLAGQVVTIEAVNPADVTVHLDDGTVLRFGTADEVVAKVGALERVLADLERRRQIAATIDVRVPSHPAAADFSCIDGQELEDGAEMC